MATKFNEMDLEIACEELSTLKYFPNDARAAVMKALAKMCPHREALRWLVNEVVCHLNEWPGLAELRGLLCTRYDPADGIDQWCSLRGYTAAEAEAKHYESHQQIKCGGYVGQEVKEVLRGIVTKAKQIDGAR